jgi:hypothetical protein
MTVEEFKEMVKSEGNPALELMDGEFSYDKEIRLVFPSGKAVNISIGRDHDFNWFEFETDEERVINNAKIAESNRKISDQFRKESSLFIKTLIEKYSTPLSSGLLNPTINSDTETKSS